MLAALRAGPEIRLAPTDSNPKATDDLDEPTPGVPIKPVGSVSMRHSWRGVAGGTPKNENSIILPGTSLREDLLSIREGRAISAHDRNGIQIFVINGRVYGVHPSKDGSKWVPFPIQGDGIAPSARGVYKALGFMVSSPSIAEAQKRLRFERINEDEIQAAWRIWDAIRRGRK